MPIPSLPLPGATPTAIGPNLVLALSYVRISQILASDDGPVAKDILKKIGQIERKAKRFCPVDTGRLRSSITSALGEEDDKIVGVVGTNVEYAPHIEFGTVNQSAQSFLRRALEEVAGP